MSDDQDLRKEAVESWLAKAEDDLAQAIHNVETDFDRYWLIAYHAQQAAEKFIKSFLIHHQVPFGKTHYIDNLRDLVRGVDSELADRLAKADDLTRYAVEVRYPATLTAADVDAEEAERAMETATHVKNLIAESLSASSDTDADPDPPPDQLEPGGNSDKVRS